MSTNKPKNKPVFNFSTMPRIAIIVSRFNDEVTYGLRDGALEWLKEHNITVPEENIMEAPGAFELPLLAQTLAKSGQYDGIICLGCVIKGDTAHFEFISLGATIGIMQASLATETPISFGILTTYSNTQALVRSRKDEDNKGREAAAACVESLYFIQQAQNL